MKVITLISKGKVKTVSIDDLKKLKIELTQTWENICNKCGKCCFDKMITDKGILVINYNSPCAYLKYIGRKAECSVYDKRFDNCSKCNTIPEAIQKRYLPADCPYVKSVVGYKAPVDNGNFYKRARQKLVKDSMYSGGDFPTGGTRNMPAIPPPRITALEAQNPTREDLGKPKDWLRRRLENKRRRQGKIGVLDPREKTTYNIKPSGHALGG
jgi:hypothetical protein